MNDFWFDIGRYNEYNKKNMELNGKSVSEKYIGGSNEILISKRSCRKMGNW